MDTWGSAVYLTYVTMFSINHYHNTIISQFIRFEMSQANASITTITLYISSLIIPFHLHLKEVASTHMNV